MEPLNGTQVNELIQALLNAFPTPDDLDQMMRVRLDKNLHAIAIGGSLEAIVFKVIRAAEAGGWTARLVAAAIEAQPRNPKLLVFAQTMELAPTTPQGHDLESFIRRTNSFLHIEQWLSKLGEISTRVCRIEVATNMGSGWGTGFLVASDLVLTNYHVLAPVFATTLGHNAGGAQARPQDVICRFDYKTGKDGVTVNAGVTFQLASEEWLRAWSFPNETSLPRPDELDYALVRLAQRAGDQMVGRSEVMPGTVQRGWIPVLEQDYPFPPHSPLFIVQHPQSQPLQVTLDTDAIIGINENQTRVHYTTNTEEGSSGSPCFNINWDLVALHHRGDPSNKRGYNAGIPLSAIVADLKQREQVWGQIGR